MPQDPACPPIPLVVQEGARVRRQQEVAIEVTSPLHAAMSPPAVLAPAAHPCSASTVLCASEGAPWWGPSALGPAAVARAGEGAAQGAGGGRGGDGECAKARGAGPGIVGPTGGVVGQMYMGQMYMGQGAWAWYQSVKVRCVCVYVCMCVCVYVCCV